MVSRFTYRSTLNIRFRGRKVESRTACSCDACGGRASKDASSTPLHTFCPYCGAATGCEHELPAIGIEALRDRQLVFEHEREVAYPDLDPPSDHRDAARCDEDEAIVFEHLSQDLSRVARLPEFPEPFRKFGVLYETMMVFPERLGEEVWTRAHHDSAAPLARVEVQYWDTAGDDRRGHVRRWYSPEPELALRAAKKIAARWNRVVRTLHTDLNREYRYLYCPACGETSNNHGQGGELFNCYSCGAWECPDCGIRRPEAGEYECEHTMAQIVGDEFWECKLELKNLPTSKVSDGVRYDFSQSQLAAVFGKYEPLLEAYESGFSEPPNEARLLYEIGSNDLIEELCNYCFEGWNSNMIVLIADDVAAIQASLDRVLEEFRQAFARFDACFDPDRNELDLERMNGKELQS